MDKFSIEAFDNLFEAINSLDDVDKLRKLFED